MYGTIADWRTYATARGNAAPTTAADADATAALVRASDYIKYEYVSRLASGYDDTLEVVELATYEAANQELTTVGFWVKAYTPSEQRIVTRVGDISFQPVNESTGKFGHSVPRSTLIEAMFAPYVNARDGEEGAGFQFQSVG
jgi:hypothetical protein